MPLCLFLFSFLSVFSQDPLWTANARIRGMSDVAAAVPDPSAWAPNPALPERIKGVRYDFSVANSWMTQGSTAVTAGMLAPLRGWMAGVGVHRFGDSFHSESVLMNNFSFHRGNTSIGIRTEYHQIRTEGFQTQGFLSCSAGTTTRLGPKISVGAMATGLVQSAFGETVQRIVPHFRAGFCLRPDERLLVAMDAHKRPDRPAGIVAGLEYRIAKAVFARFGMGTRPQSVSAGLGVQYWRLSIDQSIRLMEATGFTMQATAGYTVNRTKARE